MKTDTIFCSTNAGRTLESHRTIMPQLSGGSVPLHSSFRLRRSLDRLLWGRILRSSQARPDNEQMDRRLYCTKSNPGGLIEFSGLKRRRGNRLSRWSCWTLARGMKSLRNFKRPDSILFDANQPIIINKLLASFAYLTYPRAFTSEVLGKFPSAIQSHRALTRRARLSLSVTCTPTLRPTNKS